jgi:hypothetical protein
MWRSAADHQRYQAEGFPRLRRRAAAAEDLAEITGDLVEIEHEWSVHPSDADHTSSR